MIQQRQPKTYIYQYLTENQCQEKNGIWIQIQEYLIIMTHRL